MDGSEANTSIGSDSRNNVAKVGQSTSGSVGDVTDAGTGNCLENKRMKNRFHIILTLGKTTSQRNYRVSQNKTGLCLISCNVKAIKTIAMK
jgi:hypothetical protein